MSPARDRAAVVVLSFGDDGPPQQRWTALGESMAPYIAAGLVSEDEVLAEAGGKAAIEAWIRDGLEKGRVVQVFTWLPAQPLPTHDPFDDPATA